jgi:hypothetical protein
MNCESSILIHLIHDILLEIIFKRDCIDKEIEVQAE